MYHGKKNVEKTSTFPYGDVFISIINKCMFYILLKKYTIRHAMIKPCLVSIRLLFIANQKNVKSSNADFFEKSNTEESRFTSA